MGDSLSWCADQDAESEYQKQQQARKELGQKAKVVDKCIRELGALVRAFQLVGMDRAAVQVSNVIVLLESLGGRHP